MAAQYLRGYGIDLDAELERLQQPPSPAEVDQQRESPLGQGREGVAISKSSTSPTLISDVSLPGTNHKGTCDVEIDDDTIRDIAHHDPLRVQRYGTHRIDGGSALLAPSLCHPHVHIDKSYLLSHPRYANLQIERGDFQEAMDLTSRAKAAFTEDDLLERGQRVIDESVASGVTHMRAFVELDAGVGTKCLDTGIALKNCAEDERKCAVQICAFAQLPLFSLSKDDESGSVIRGLMQHAASMNEVAVVGSTPYVEADRNKMEHNVTWMIDLAIANSKHLDFHLDYNLNASAEPMVWHVIKTLKEKDWIEQNQEKTVVLGHCTRLTLFTDDEWSKLKDEIGVLPISFVGLPTSDMFMMRTPDQTRGTLDIPRMIKCFGLNACMGINNIGNAFTPQGSCDPLTLACNGVGVYQAGTQHDAELLYECVSSRARQAIGYESFTPCVPNGRLGSLQLHVGDQANLLLFASDQSNNWRTRRSVHEAVYLHDSCKGRRACLNGRLTC